NGVIIPALVDHGEPIASSALGRKQRVCIRPGFAVESPTIVTATAPRNLFENKLDALVRLGHRSIIAEDCVVPRRSRWREPLRLTVLVRVFDNNTKSHRSVLVLQRRLRSRRRDCPS